MKLADKCDDVFLRDIVVLAGHGGFCRVYREREKTITVPEGTTVTFWCPHESGQFAAEGVNTLDNELGKVIDVTNGLSKMCERVRASNSQLPKTFEAGDRIINYVLLSPDNLKLGEARSVSRLATVKQPGLGQTKGVFLEDLLYQFRGKNCHWAACREVINLADIVLDGGELVAL